MSHVCGELCYFRGAVDFQAMLRGDPRRHLLDGKRLTKEEYLADPRHIAHFEIRG